MTVAGIYPQSTSFGGHLRYWRTARGLTQLELAHRAASTSRHISFMETGRSRPGETMVLRLAEALEIPGTDRNDLLEAAGYPGIFIERKLDKEAIVPFQKAIQYTVTALQPFPSFAINRWYDILEMNEAADAMFGGDRPDKKMNIVSCIFEDPDMQDRMENWSAVARAMACRLRHEVSSSPRDQRLQDLLALAHRTIEGTSASECARRDDQVICPTFRVGDRLVRTISMVARFGLTRGVMMDELRVETIFPRDTEAENFFHALADGKTPQRPCWQ